MPQDDVRQQMDDYLDGALAPAEEHAFKALLAQDAGAVRQLERLKNFRALRSAAYDSYLPTAQETARLTEQFFATAHQPAGFVGFWRKARSYSNVAAVLAIMAGTFAFGRMTANSTSNHTTDGMAAGTVYKYRVIDFDAEGVERMSDDFGTIDEAGTYIKNLERDGPQVAWPPTSRLPAGQL